jgi:hypothetical protein
MHPNVNTARPILFGWDVLVYHFHLQFPVLTRAYGKKLIYILEKNAGIAGPQIR